MRKITILIFLLLATLFAGSSLAAPDSLTRVTRAWKGDLPELLEKRHPIRVLVSYNRTNFFMVRGEMRGLEFDLMRAYEKYLAKTHKKDHVRMVFVAVPFDDLIPALLDGRGDIIAAGLTVTPDRSKKVSFSTPYRANITEIIISGRGVKPIAALTDLAGQTVHVLAGSSYAAHLESVNAELKKRGMKRIKIVQADSHLVTEDLLEMAERGMIKYTVADGHLVEVWKSALHGLKVFTDIPLHSGGDLAWAVRPGSKELVKSLSDFATTVRQGTLMGNMVFNRYYVNTDWVKNPTDASERKKLGPMVELFEKYAKMYGFDWLKIAALAYQESRFDMGLKSSMGAVGVMQIKPSTAGDPNVNVQDIHELENNIHAGVKYLRFLRDNYFKDVARDAQVDFALAAYNAGPNRVIGLRKKAREMGLDPNIWFGNVEWAAYSEIGPETPTYVANVQMYFAAYKSVAKVLTSREGASK